MSIHEGRQMVTDRSIAGRYTLQRELGRGGMGVVWRAEDELLGREVALKRIGMGPAATYADTARAAREARLAATLNHAHVVAVFDLAHHGDEQWLVMELVEGLDLARLVRERGPLTADAAARLLRQAADALAAAHRAGIVHRDVKPSNILVTGDGTVKLTDFGIARGQADTTLTATGLMTGSPAYLAPEVASGSSATAASDVWSLGATLYHALTGEPPFEVAGNVVAALYRIVHEEPPRPPGAGWLAPLLDATMAKDPAARWPMAEVAAFLARGGPDRSYAEPPLVVAPTPRGHRSTAASPDAGRPRRPGRWRWAVAAGALAAAGVAGWVVADPLGEEQRPAAGGPSSVESPTRPAQPAEQPTPAEEMAAFVEDYLTTVTRDPATAWRSLTPRFQQASKGFEAYRGWWSQVSSAELGTVTADPDAMTVGYRVTYEMADGSTRIEDVTLELVTRGDRYLIAGEG